MTDDELSLDDIDELLATPEPKLISVKVKLPGFKPPPQTSTFILWGEKENRCASRGCSAPTYVQLKGVPYCTIHIIQIMGDMLDNQINHYPNRSPEVERVLNVHLQELINLS